MKKQALVGVTKTNDGPGFCQVERAKDSSAINIGQI
jgi:hypothetical protein